MLHDLAAKISILRDLGQGDQCSPGSQEEINVSADLIDLMGLLEFGLGCISPMSVTTKISDPGHDLFFQIMMNGPLSAFETFLSGRNLPRITPFYVWCALGVLCAASSQETERNTQAGMHFLAGFHCANEVVLRYTPWRCLISTLRHGTA